MIIVKIKTVIGRPREQVFEFVARQFVENLGRWNPALLRIEQTSPGPITVGTTGREVQRIQGKEVGRNFKIEAFEPPQRFVVVNDGNEGVRDAVTECASRSVGSFRAHGTVRALLQCGPCAERSIPRTSAHT